MKTLEEIKECNRLIVGKTGEDGGSGEIHMPRWAGKVIWSFGGGWEHVSVSPYKKTIVPTWDDMCRIKDIFFRKEECVVQYHPAEKDYVNLMPNCLHLWRPINVELPVPPKIFV